MCGFISILSSNLNKQKASESLQKINHRGPDDSNEYIDNTIYLGHNRLVVVDKENGKQPFYFDDYIMIYNGELYNTDELRNELKQKGYAFSGHSDTEVLVKMYAHYGAKALQKLNGIYAFLVYNKKTKEVFAARDRAGVKPLFYYHKNNDFAFSSEMKAILHYFNVRKITKKGLQQVLGLGPSRIAGNGLYENVYELKPAHYLVVKNGKIKIKEYWNVESKEFNQTYSQAVETTRFLVEDSVKRQLVSDVPLCTLLSGGLDSTTITLLSKKYKPNLESFSIDYEDNSKFFSGNDFQVSQDNDFIKLVTEVHSVKHHYKTISTNDTVNYLERALELKDYPGMVDIESSLLWFSHEIKKEFTVALSGECADEVFGGYPWFYRNTNHFGFPWIRNLDERNALLNKKYQKSLEIKDFVISEYNKSVNKTPLNGTESEIEKAHKQMFYLNTNWFMQTLLERKDRMTMGASLEVRVPFADHRLIEYLYNVPWDYKFKDGVEKALLRDAVKDVVPNEILTRKKNPYPKTHNPKYLSLVSEKLKLALNDKNSILHELFDANVLNELLNNNSNTLKTPWFGQLMTQPQLIAYLYQLHYWFKTYDINFTA